MGKNIRTQEKTKSILSDESLCCTKKYLIKIVHKLDDEHNKQDFSAIVVT